MQLGLCGCYMQGSISSLEPSHSLSSTGIPSMESVSGSTNSYSATSISGYQVRHSVGILLDKHYAVTTSGYQAYLQVNGRAASEEKGKK